MTDYQIHLDGDNLLFSFDDHVIDYFKLKNIPCDLPLGLYPWIPEGSSIRYELNNLMKDYYFWRNMPIYPWAYEIIAIARKYGTPRILTKGMKNAGCFGGKIEAIKFHFPELENKVGIVTMDKWTNSNPRSILIDDDIRHKKKWEEMGGAFYHWRNIRGTNEGAELIKKELDKLDKFLDNATFKGFKREYPCEFVD